MNNKRTGLLGNYKKQEFRDVSFFVKYCNYIWYGIVLVACGWIAKMYLPDGDSYFLAATGRYIVENREVPKINPFIIHEGFGTIIQQWVVDVLNYLAYDKLGAFGMYIWIGIFFVVTNFMLYTYLSLYTDNFRLKIYVMALSSVVATSFANMRPTSISLNILLAELILLEKYSRGKSKSSIWFIPLLSLLMINCHAALWPFLIVLMMPYLVPALPDFKSLSKLKYHFNKWWKLLVVIIPTLGVGIINPNGIKGMLYVFYSYSGVSSDNIVQELESAKVFGIMGFTIILCSIVFALYINRYRSNVNWKNIYLALGTYVLAIKHVRNVWFLILSITPLAVMVFRDCVKDTVKVRYTEKEYKLLSVVFTMALVIMFSIIDEVIPFDDTEDSATVPLLAAEYLEEIPEDKQDDIVLFTGFNNGNYMEWKGYKVYIDARPELFQPKITGQEEDIFEEYKNVFRGKADIPEFLNKYNFTHLIVQEDVLATYLKYSDDYKLVVESEEYDLFERVDF